MPFCFHNVSFSDCERAGWEGSKKAQRAESEERLVTSAAARKWAAGAWFRKRPERDASLRSAEQPTSARTIVALRSDFLQGDHAICFFHCLRRNAVF
jgi:hypothetical protein